ncbi:hypothetical protein SAMN06295912_12220 [Sphingomonas laterariae]|uniref:Uncharacterized protein n=1 Tax=Edaphosphingomonas laterariae TaxID=861865 RepID=A0A239I5Q4_9SPHN|nr:hypothetical protein SAMN06295912_12220 [Sphingomonas laterariae]
MTDFPKIVMPAKAGIALRISERLPHETPAFGVTKMEARA